MRVLWPDFSRRLKLTMQIQWLNSLKHRAVVSYFQGSYLTGNTEPRSVAGHFLRRSLLFELSLAGWAQRFEWAEDVWLRFRVPRDRQFWGWL